MSRDISESMGMARGTVMFFRRVGSRAFVRFVLTLVLSVFRCSVRSVPSFHSVWLRSKAMGIEVF